MSAERCARCKKTEPEVKLSVCCSSHGKTLCHRDYRLTHFVEICGATCARCAGEGLPRIYPEPKIEQACGTCRGMPDHAPGCLAVFAEQAAANGWPQ